MKYIIEKYNEVDRDFLALTLLQLQMYPVTIEQANFYFVTKDKKGVYFLGGDPSNYLELFIDHVIILTTNGLWKWSYFSSYEVKGQVLCVLNSESCGDNTSHPILSPTNSLPPNVDYLGCFFDSWGDRVLPKDIAGVGKTVVDCVNVCKGFKYLGRQDSGKCWCGNGDYGKHGVSYGCDCDGKYVGEEKQCVYKYKNVSTSVIPIIMHDTNVVVPSDPSS